MDIQLAAEERIYLIEERLTADEIQQRAMDRRVQAFGGGLGGLLQRPKSEDIVLLERQRRLEPFWHVACRARYVYERNREYVVPASAPEVHAVAVAGTTYEVQDARQPRAFSLSAREHCLEEYALERYTDGMTGAPTADAATLLGGPRSEVSDPSSLAGEGTIVVPPEHRASFVVRKLLAEMMKPLQADAVTEETLTLEATDLYYRPMWAFEFHWKPRDKKGVVEIDAVTGQTRQGQSLLPQLKGMVSRDMLFDIGADTAGMLIPGGSIAIKVAKAAMDKRA